jgi:hypothetical protein
MSNARLGLYSTVFPAIALWRDTLTPVGMDEVNSDKGTLTLAENVHKIVKGAEMLEAAETAIVFDCRALPRGFVEDTGAAVFDEASKLGEPVHLPHPCCYFEFADQTGVLALEVEWFKNVDLGRMESKQWSGYPAPKGFSGTGQFVEFYPFTLGLGPNEFLTQWRERYGEFRNGLCLFDDDPLVMPFVEAVNSTTKADDDAVAYAAQRLLGVLALLTDKLVIDTPMPDPTPRLTRARKKRGRLPLSGDTHVLHVNVPAVVRSVARTTGTTHESPVLHWRRGHWRVVVEGRTWVRRCLVGDPEKGFLPPAEYRIKVPRRGGR